MSTWTALVVAAVLLLANAFFVAVEFALVASRRTRIEPLVEGGSRRARMALGAMGDLNVQLSGSQLGITMASLGLGFVAEPAVAGLLEQAIEGVVELPSGVLHAVSLTVALSLVVFLHMVLGEMVPKSIAITSPESTLLWLALPNAAYMLVFRPVIRALTGLANLGVRAVGVEPRDDLEMVHTAEEFAAMLGHSREEGLIEEFEHTLLRGVLDFGERHASEVMTPWAGVTTITEAVTVTEAEAHVVATGHSRLPVVGTDGAPRGFVHAKDLLTLSPAAGDRAVPARLIRRMLMVPGTRTLDDVLLAMRRSRVHVAAVAEAGAPGDVAGLVTIEDLLEELVGDILDESDHQDPA